MTAPHGYALIGWIDDRVLYARFDGTISSELGTRFASRFAELVGDSVAVHYFNDSSEVRSYDLDGYTALTLALQAKRDQFKLIVVRPWCARMTARGRALAASLGCLEYVSSATEFAARLRAAAPAVDVAELVALADPSKAPAPGPSRTSPAPLERAPVERSLEPLPRTYVFDLSDFERGCFTAARFDHLLARPRGSWVCVARSDEQALSLARQAALVEWAKPTSRAPETFSVRFVDGAPETPLDRRR